MMQLAEARGLRSRTKSQRGSRLQPQIMNDGTSESDMIGLNRDRNTVLGNKQPGRGGHLLASAIAAAGNLPYVEQ